MAAAQRRWGWHRLDPGWAHRLVADAGLPSRALVLDVGAGDGVITAALLGVGARVVAVEPHPQRALVLRERFGDSIVIVRADGADLRVPRRPFHVVANPPFHITSALLRRLLQPGSRLRSARLVVQGQAAARWASTDAPAYGRWSGTFTVAMGPSVPRRAFTPPPRVNARVLIVERHRSAGAASQP